MKVRTKLVFDEKHFHVIVGFGRLVMSFDCCHSTIIERSLKVLDFTAIS
jgi:hypothetical protein